MTGIYEHMRLSHLKELDKRYRLSDQGGKLILRHIRREDLSLELDALLGEPQHPVPTQAHDTKPEPLVFPCGTQEDVSVKLDKYITALANNFEDNGPSRILYITLRQARIMAPAIEVGVFASSWRSAPNRLVQDTLIPRAILMWTITQILTSPGLPFNLSYRPPGEPENSDPTSLPFLNTAPQADGHAPPLAVLTTYLLSCLERRAARLCHALLTDLERALLRTNRARGFDLFPVAVLLLTCVERMEWFARSFEGGAKAAQARNTLSFSADCLSKAPLFRICERHGPR